VTAGPATCKNGAVRRKLPQREHVTTDEQIYRREQVVGREHLPSAPCAARSVSSAASRGSRVVRAVRKMGRKERII
jgi:hypothetical protein